MTTLYEDLKLKVNPERDYNPTTDENTAKWAKLRRDIALGTPAGMCRNRDFVLYCLKEKNRWVIYDRSGGR